MRLSLNGWISTFLGENPSMPFPLSPQGTDFQQRVWAYLAQIPLWGESDLWRDCPGLVLWIGPSHRSSSRSESLDPPHPLSPGAGDGEKKLTGYAAGLDRKRWLLQHEAISWKE